MSRSNRAESEPDGGSGRRPPSASKKKEQSRASVLVSHSPSLPLSPRERMIAVLFADDHTAEEIALVLGLTGETVRGYLGRARLKYRNAGRPVVNKLQLRVRLVEDGHFND